MAGDWRRLHNDELHNLYDRSNIVRVIKLRMMRQTVYASSMEEMTNA
jgi:hypothetical protein